MTIESVVGVEAMFQFLVTKEDGVTPYTGLVDADFSKFLYKDDAVSAVVGSVVEISNGTYRFAFTPDAAGIWLAQFKVIPTGDWIGEYFQVSATSGGGQLAEAQMNVAYDGTVNLLRMEVWLDRDGQSVAAASLVSCSVDFYDVAGTLVFSVASSSPKADGHFSLSNSFVPIANRPYNAVVTVVDSAGTVTTYQAISSVE